MLVAMAAVEFRITANARPLVVPAPRSALVALDQVRDAFRGMGSLHVRAVAEVTIERPSGTVSGSGSFEYWELGAKYRIDNELGPTLGQHRGTTITYDGTRFAYYDKGQSHLSYSGTDTRNNPTFLPNPVLLIVDFLRGGIQDNCGNCRVRLADLNNESQWDDTMSSFQLGPGETVETVRQTAAGHRVHHRVKLSADGQQRIVRIEREDEKSRGTAVIDFGAHDSEGLPRLVTVTAKSKAGTLYASFLIETLEPATSADDSLFSVDSSGVRTVWDVDSETFLRMPGANRPVSLAEIVQRCLARRSGGKSGGAPK